MEPIIKVKDYILKEFEKLLVPGECLKAVIPYGGISVGGGEAAQKSSAWDYFILTGTRAINIKRTFFVNRTGVASYPLRYCTNVELTAGAAGCRLTIKFEDKNRPGAAAEINIPSLRKADGEEIVRELTKENPIFRCPKCCQTTDDKNTFCVKCGATVRNICPRCGKTLDSAGKQCQLCS